MTLFVPGYFLRLLAQLSVTLGAQPVNFRLHSFQKLLGRPSGYSGPLKVTDSLRNLRPGLPTGLSTAFAAGFIFSPSLRPGGGWASERAAFCIYRSPASAFPMRVFSHNYRTYFFGSASIVRASAFRSNLIFTNVVEANGPGRREFR
jgi:hypothetical protein